MVKYADQRPTYKLKEYYVGICLCCYINILLSSSLIFSPKHTKDAGTAPLQSSQILPKTVK